MKKLVIFIVIFGVFAASAIFAVPSAEAAAPVWKFAGNRTIYAGSILNLTVSATDADGDYLYYDAFNEPAGSYFDPISHTLYWKPNPDQLGQYTVEFTVTDHQTTLYKTVTITVVESPDTQDSGNTAPAPAPAPSPANNAPQFSGFNPSLNAAVNQLYTYDANAVDADNNPLTYSLVFAPSGMAINSATGFIAWVPVNSQIGQHSVRVAVSDGRASATADFSVTVAAAPAPAPAPKPLPSQPSTPSLPSNPSPSSPKLTISDIKIESDGGEISVSWKTNFPSGSRVIYGTVSQQEKTRDFTYANATEDDRELFTSHTVKVENLEKDTVYYLRAVSKTDTETAVSREIAVVILESGEARVLFGASLIDIFGSLFRNTSFLWIIIAGLAATLILFYRKRAKSGTSL